MKKLVLLFACVCLLLLAGSSTASAQPYAAHLAQVKLFFPKTSDPTFNHVYSVTRFVIAPATATGAMQLVIAGPTLSEQGAYKIYSEVNEILTGLSNCNHRDFQIMLNHKGSVAEHGTATLQFCRDTQSPGIGADARITAQINATLKQFSGIKKVVILTKGGNCFGDESGLNQCLK